MQDSAFELGEQISLRKIEYKMYQPLWEKYDLSSIDMNFVNWTTIKYLNDTGTSLNASIRSIPNTSGGLYLFSIKCFVMDGITHYPVYVGRAKTTDSQNLRKRVREYFTKFSKDSERPKITRMFKYWSNELYLSYMPLDDNAGIIDFEKKLINSLLLPFNTEIPDKEIRDAIIAF